MVGIPDGPDGGRLAKPKVHFQYHDAKLFTNKKNKSSIKCNKNLVLPELFSWVMYVTEPRLDGPFEAVLPLFGVVLGLLLVPMPAKLTPPVGVRG